MGGWVGIITSNEVTVVGGDNSVLVSFLHILTVPLANAGSTSICQNCPTKLSEGLSLKGKCVSVNSS